jgi:glycosyltransferase involved in cell wall biosynthesis
VPSVAIALLTTYLTAYRVPLYKRLAERHGVEVLCYGGGERYVPSWFSDLDAQIAAAPFPARRLNGVGEALNVAKSYDAVIAPFAGGAILPAAYAGARARGRPFILWASVWAQPRSLAHALALPATRRIYRRADAILAYGEHVRRFVTEIRDSEENVFVAPQAVEPQLFAREVAAEEVEAFRAANELGAGPLVLYAGRLVREKGIEVLLDAWPRLSADGTLVMIGDGPLATHAREQPRVRLLRPVPRQELPAAYAASSLAVLPSIPTPRFREPWGLVCNEAMHQGRPVVVSDSVGAAAGGLVRDGESGVVVRSGDPAALALAIDTLLKDPELRRRLGAGALAAVARYTYDAAAAAFERAVATALQRGR